MKNVGADLKVRPFSFAPYPIPLLKKERDENVGTDLSLAFCGGSAYGMTGLSGQV